MKYATNDWLLSRIKEPDYIEQTKTPFKYAQPGYCSIDGYNTYEKLALLITRIRKSVPYLNLKLKPAGDSGVNEVMFVVPGDPHIQKEYVVNRFVMYIEGDLLMLCAVRITSPSNPGEMCFSSRLVKNNRFAKTNPNYYEIKSADPIILARKAFPFIKEYGARELAMCLSDRLITQISVAKNNLLSDVSRLFNLINTRDALLTEISGLRAQGVQFTTQAFREFAATYEETIREHNMEKDRPVNMYFVRIDGDGVEGKITVTPVNSVNTYYPECGEPKVYTSETIDSVPAVIPERIKVLAVLDNNQYVHRIGMKIDEKHYWVEA